MTLTRDEVKQLSEIFLGDQPIDGHALEAMTGLNPRMLQDAGIIKHLGRWDSGFVKSHNFPNLEEPSR